MDDCHLSVLQFQLFIHFLNDFLTIFFLHLIHLIYSYLYSPISYSLLFNIQQTTSNGVHLLANSLVEWTSVFETFFIGQLPRRVDFSFWNVPCLSAWLWANFLIFIQYSTEQYSTVQVFIWCSTDTNFRGWLIANIKSHKKDSHRRSRRNLFSVVGLSSVCVFSP